jgi:two-component system, OmpR family, phosphate regulon response regulator PhoB
MKPTILIVEDDVALSDLLVWTFANEGYDVRHTGDGEEALLMVREQLPDAILLDWMVDNIPGIEVCRQLRKAPASKAVPIIMLTARGEEEDRIRGLKTGADDYVTKPFSPRELVARVEALLRRSRPSIGGGILNFADIELDPATHRATNCSMRFGAWKRISTCARLMSISAACAKRSICRERQI